ncbi:MAG: GNAT family N-acetyltransferase [Armatimonadota bacterium]
MIIRPERAEDFPQIYDLVKVAFETAEVSSGQEQNFVNHLRGGSNYIPQLALVAEEDGKLIGHIMLTRTSISVADGEFPTLLLGPISVLLEHRKAGVGSALIHESFRLARELGHQSAVLVGNPAYYHRFGFKTAADFGIRNENGIPDEYVMACELVPKALDGVDGTILFETGEA